MLNIWKDLKVPPGNQLEALKGDRKGQYSIRINEQYRICFIWTEFGPRKWKSWIITGRKGELLWLECQPKEYQPIQGKCCVKNFWNQRNYPA